MFMSITDSAIFSNKIVKSQGQPPPKKFAPVIIHIHVHVHVYVCTYIQEISESSGCDT